MPRAKPASSSRVERPGVKWQESSTNQSADEFLEKLVAVNRVAKVVKGGRQFGFTALTVVGDGAGRVGFGYGKAREVPVAIQKAMRRRARTWSTYRLEERHAALRRHAAATARRACTCSRRRTVRASSRAARMRAVLECAGVRNVLAKSYGSRNPINVVRATIDALSQHALARRDRGEARQDGRRDPRVEANMADMASEGQQAIAVTLREEQLRGAARGIAERRAGSACAGCTRPCSCTTRRRTAA